MTEGFAAVLLVLIAVALMLCVVAWELWRMANTMEDGLRCHFLMMADDAPDDEEVVVTGSAEKRSKSPLVRHAARHIDGKRAEAGLYVASD